MNPNEAIVDALQRAADHSPFLRHAIERNADLTALLAAGDLDGAIALAKRRGEDAESVGAGLRRERAALALVLAVGDLAGLLSMEVVTRELSDLADRALDRAIAAAIAERTPDEAPRGFAALALGILMTLPIGGADMPVVISLYNAFTGLAVAFEGYVQGNVALIIAGTVVGAAGTLLTRLMAKAMNRSISNVLFSNFGSGGGGSSEIAGSMKPIEAGDAASLLYMAEKVIIVPGYGMAVAQAQHKIWELSQQLIKRDKTVKFAIHPVAGRMPGHMNVLLAEAGVPYDLIADMDDVNPEFATCDVAIVIGANDVVNPVARTDKSSPIYGMPILDVINARQVIVIKRGKGAGFAGIENALFYADNCRMLYADGQEAANRLIAELKGIDSGGGH